MVIGRELIPKHKNCNNCGECCGPVPINEKEFKEITEYIAKNKPAVNEKHSELECKFRVDGKCSIYPVRPILCRLMGVTNGMSCSNGNSARINGYQFMDMNEKIVGLINSKIK